MRGLVCTVVILSAYLSFVSIFEIRDFEWRALAWMGFLLLVTAVSAPFLSIPFKSADETLETRLSPSWAFILFSGITFGPAAATLVAAVEGASASFRTRDLKTILVSASASSVAAHAAFKLYGVFTTFPAHVGGGETGQIPNFSQFIPLFFLAVIVQHVLWAFVSGAYFFVGSGKYEVPFSPTGLVWTAALQSACAVAAALFHLAWQGGGIALLPVGIVILALSYLFYRFNKRRLEALRSEEEKNRKQITDRAELYLRAVESLAMAIDAKDQTTQGHVRRTQIYASELGKVLGVGPSELDALKAGALLHDVGKLAVPEYILNKPGKLTAAEFEKMKVHTIVGGDIVKRVNFPYPVEEVVRHHHEKWDGSGYPLGLKGERIPLVARIISVVDFYDATRCDRPYRPGMKREESVELLLKMAGSSFDPRVVENFVANLNRFDALIRPQDAQEQVSDHDRVPSEAGRVANEVGGTTSEEALHSDPSGFRTIAEAQREVFALHEIAQTIGSSLNLQDTVSLVSSKLRAIVPFDTCVIFVVDEKTGKARPAHATGVNSDFFSRRTIPAGEGITGWVIANARSMCNASADLDLVGVPADVAEKVQSVLVSPLIREDGAFGCITLYSATRSAYVTEHVRLLESVCIHAASALNNALTFEKTKESALTDPLTELPNARALHLMLDQRIAECQRLNREPMALLSMDLDDFKKVNDTFGHGVGDRLLAGVAGVIKAQLRQMDVLARFAGDEFVVIMPMASAEVASIVADRVRSAVESQKFPVRTGRTAQVGVSMGVACFPADGEAADQLLMVADRNMQRDKHSRKVNAPARQGQTPVVPLDTYR